MTNANPLIAITGASVLTPLGDSPDALHAALCEGQVALRPSSDFGGIGLASIRDFEATRYANIRGMRMYNRTTRLGICAAQLALNEARIAPPAFPGEDLGLLMASTFGHLDVLIEYDRSLVINGTQRTNGALMPLAIPSAPGAIAALAFGAKAFSMTLCDGAASALDAVGLAARWIADERAKACVVVAAFSPSPDVVRLVSRAGMLAPTGEVRPFDERASGAGLGEGAVAFVLERADDAQRRSATPHGYVRGHGAAFAKDSAGLTAALQRASASALRAANLSGDEVTLISAGASGNPSLDRAEARALCSLFGAQASRVPVMAVAGALGDTIDAAAALSALVALSAFESGKAPPIARLEAPAVSGLHYLMRGEPVKRGVALVTALTPGGSCSALLLSDSVPS
jgi:3-oxoacyl-[acyl-carrier-protein] synthase II